MRKLILFAFCLLVVSGLACYGPERYAPTGQPENGKIDYWIAQMKGIDPGTLSAEQREGKQSLLTRAWQRLTAAGKPAAKRLRQELVANPDDAYFQLSAATVLYQIEGQGARPEVLGALKRTSMQDNSFQYFYLCHRLARSRYEAVLPVLEQTLANRKIYVFIDEDSPRLDPRAISIYLYGVFGQGSIPALKEACTNENPIVRANAAAVLGYFGDDDPLFVLAGLLNQDADERVRAAAANALGQVNHVAAIRPLRAALTNDKSPSVRAACAFGLGEIQHEGCIDGLAISLNDLSPQVRQCSINSLEYIGTERCADVVANRLAVEKDPGVRLALTNALGFLGYDKWLPVLKRLSEESSGNEGTAAARSIKRIAGMGPRSREAYPDLEGSAVSPKKLEKILAELYHNYGRGIDQHKKSIFLSAAKDHLPQLEELRCRVLWVVDADSMARLGEISKLIRLVKRKSRGMP